jgi:1-acyl-sn-glycerol-3-phosphate acyltransferase
MANDEVFVHGWASPRQVEFMRGVFEFLLRTLSHLEIYGTENLLPGGIIITPNHLSVVDAPLVFINVPNRKRTALVADKHQHHWFFRPIVTMVDCIWVNRGNTSPSTIKAAVRALQNGSMLGVAPEGTRSPTHSLLLGKTGAIYLAYASGVPIIPAAITGAEKAIPSILRLRRARVTITFGAPLIFGTLGQRTRATQQQLEDGATELMCQIAALLPLEYHGVYADHPRVQELLAAKAQASAAQPAHT